MCPSPLLTTNQVQIAMQPTPAAPPGAIYYCAQAMPQTGNVTAYGYPMVPAAPGIVMQAPPPGPGGPKLQQGRTSSSLSQDTSGTLTGSTPETSTRIHTIESIAVSFEPVPASGSMHSSAVHGGAIAAAGAARDSTDGQQFPAAPATSASHASGSQVSLATPAKASPCQSPGQPHAFYYLPSQSANPPPAGTPYPAALSPAAGPCYPAILQPATPQAAPSAPSGGPAPETHAAVSEHDPATPSAK